MTHSDDDVVAAYWEHHILTGGDRSQRLAAEQLFWAVDAVGQAMGGKDPLALLDRLVSSERADLCYLGAGPVEDLLSEAGARWDQALADRARGDARWREVLPCVWLSDAERNVLGALKPYLKPTNT